MDGSVKIALIGNPNCGKTTLFNYLTGSKQYVGNWPGVTVEKKEGIISVPKILKDKYNFKTDVDVVMTDLPGIYSLSPYSMEEIVTREYLLNAKPDFILNIIDATNLERNLFLTTQIMDMKTNTVIALNMIDAIESNGISIDIPALEVELGIKIFPISASKGQGIPELLEYIYMAINDKTLNKVSHKSAFNVDFSHIETIVNKYKSNYQTWYAIKILENDEKVIQMLENLSDTDRAKIETYQQQFSSTEISNLRYEFINKITLKVKHEKNNFLSFSDKIDAILTNRIIGIPIFLIIMFFIFQITFGTVGSTLMKGVQYLIDVPITSAIDYLLTTIGASEIVKNLIIDGIIAGVGGVISFVPQIMLLFFFMSFLEDSGYMARVAFVMDLLLRKIGLNGKAFIPMILGFGCTVPAIMATKALEKESDRKLTIMLVPFISCSAKTPVYAIFIAAFFSQYKGLITFFIYFLGIVVAILMGLLLKKTIFKSDGMPFVMELPQYRIPAFKGLMLSMWDKGKSFIIKAGTVILAASVLIWIMRTFSFSFKIVESSNDSMIAGIGKFISPIFTPLGFGDWRASAALLTGFTAKEAIVSTLEILYTSGNSSNLVNTLNVNGVFTAASALSYMVFILLYTPCMAAVAAMRKEFGSWKWTFFTIGYQLICAYFFSFLTYSVASLIFK